jgi:hypothetical protein
MLAAFRSPLVDTLAKVMPVVRQPCRKFGDGSLRDRGFLTTRSRERAVSLVERRASSPVNPSAARQWRELKGSDLWGCDLLQPAILLQLVNQDRNPSRNLTCA